MVINIFDVLTHSMHSSTHTPQPLQLLWGRCTIKSYTWIKDRNPFSAVSWEVSEAFARAKRSVVPAAATTLLSPDTSNRIAT